IVFPGGYGTLDELFESVTLVQTGKVEHFPLVLYGRSYWEGLLDWLRGTVQGSGRIGPHDVDLLTLTDDPDEVVRIMIESRDRELMAREEAEAAGSEGAPGEPTTAARRVRKYDPEADRERRAAQTGHPD
ncbi:MAG: LOG family protein, partial [Candidatus Limnocylindrales bacterium]